MLVKGGIDWDARVRRESYSLDRAGFDVVVLGTTDEEVPTTEFYDGFELRLLPMPERLPPERLVRRGRKIRRRITRLEARADDIASQLQSKPGGARRRILEQRQKRTARSLERAERSAKKVRSAEKQAMRDDPLDVAGFAACWWPTVEELRPDVVHIHKGWGFEVARRAAADGARWIYDGRADPYKARMSVRTQEAMRKQIARNLPHADAVLTGSEPHLEQLEREFELPRLHLVVHDAPLLQDGPAPRPGLREQAGVGPEQPLLVYAGGLTKYRPLTVVVEAMAALPAVHFAVVVTADHWLDEPLARAEELGVDDRVHIIPKVVPEAVVPFIVEADVGVFPLTRYVQGDMALPNKLFEYLYAGLPMVMSDSPTIADFIRRYGVGEVVPVDDPSAWAGAIERVLAAPRYRDRTAEWEALKAEWSWEGQAKKLIGVYRELMRADAPAA